jgi:cytochrome c oxidase subunit 2
MRSLDVIHSFWVNEFRQKQDVLPTQPPDSTFPTHVKITPTKTGRFNVICTELCGAGHAFMRSYAIVMSEAGFQQWAKSQGKAVTSGKPGEAGAAVFENQGCGSCHTFAPAKATAKVGPDLDKLPQYAKTAGKPLDAFIRESIVNPGAYVEKGYPNNVMPSFAQLPKEQLDALVQYLSGSDTKGSS